MSRLVKLLRERHQETRKSILVPEFNPDGDPMRCYYFAQTPRHLSDALRLMRQYKFEDDHMALAAAMICVRLLDENNERLVADGEYLDFISSVPEGALTRIVTEIGDGVDIAIEIENAKKS